MFTSAPSPTKSPPTRRSRSTCSKPCGVRHIELRSIHKTNVLDLTDLQVSEFKALLDRHGFKLSAIGSPIGKIKIDEPFEPHLKRFERAIELCKVFGTPNIRIFSYYPPEGDGDWDDWRARGARPDVRRRCELAEKAGVRLLHENEHRIYGDSPGPRRGPAARRSRAARPLRGASTTRPTTSSAATTRGRAGRRRRSGPSTSTSRTGTTGEEHGRLAGEGQGRIPEVMAEAVQMRLRRLRHAGAAPARRRADRRRHRAGAVPEGGRGVQEDPRPGRGEVPVSTAWHTVHVRVNDAATGQPTPVRIRFTDAEGDYFAPFGRLADFATGPGRGRRRQRPARRRAVRLHRRHLRDPPARRARSRVEVHKGPEYRPLAPEVTLRARASWRCG